MLSAAALSSYAYVAPAAPAVKAPAMIRMEEGTAVAQFEGPAPPAGLESLAAEASAPSEESAADDESGGRSGGKPAIISAMAACTPPG